MEALGPWHLLIVAAVFVVFFGAKRLPDAARSLGRSAKILKAELKDAPEEPATPTPVVATVPGATPADVTPPVTAPVPTQNR